MLNIKQKYNIVINNFEGPLDLLLYLITKNKMNIFDISLNELTDKYIEYLNQMNDENIEITSEFVVTASTLLDIKARKLLPEIEPKEEDESVSEEDIINKIIEYKKYKEISSKIYEMYSNNFGSFVKPFSKIKYKEKRVYSGEKIDIQELYKTYDLILFRNLNKINKKSEEIKKIAIYEKITVKDKVKQIVDYLGDNDSMIFNNVFDVEKLDNIEVVTAFLGMLELSKLKEVDIEQRHLFSDINIEKTENFGNIDISKIVG